MKLDLPMTTHPSFNAAHDTLLFSLLNLNQTTTEFYEKDQIL